MKQKIIRSQKPNRKFNNRKGYVHEEKIYNQKHEVSHSWYYFSERENDQSKPSTIREIIVNNKVNGKYMSESFCCGFYFNPYTNRYEWRDFAKTQIFNQQEAEPNLKFHIWIIKTLCMIKLRFIENLEIDDEGDYFFTEKTRKENLDYFKNNLGKYPSYQKHIDTWKTLKPFDIKTLVQAHGQNLQLINGVILALQKFDFEKEVKSSDND
ncbi:MAG: hypothetical protein JW795_00440 [Chitinivibrionales bacterium]|nr:hypothetical protein [Chitinivibrionales bacterium]